MQKNGTISNALFDSLEAAKALWKETWTGQTPGNKSWRGVYTYRGNIKGLETTN